jgi:poly(3-hydroxyalkanoate) synthetase
MGGTLFSRYIREMVHAVDLNNDGMISEDELLHMMEHMSVERALTQSELHTLFEELGDNKQIATDAVEDLVLQRLHESEMNIFENSSSNTDSHDATAAAHHAVA